jgi:hypothetical protein
MSSICCSRFWKRAKSLTALARGTGNGDKAFSFKGVSIIKIEGDKIRSDEAYFDPRAFG